MFSFALVPIGTSSKGTLGIQEISFFNEEHTSCSSFSSIGSCSLRVEVSFLSASTRDRLPSAIACPICAELELRRALISSIFLIKMRFFSSNDKMYSD
ncbi:hypothetical protein FXW24_02585 [Candidatus Liberibacter asiaticus]|nr:hypothetical protein FXW31_04125 [Candidatus Liberibacter asiaticus]KAE9517575.1 hypothetical protein FXW24_02585 [Candidatus Liberibacter asiaticus]